MARRKTKLKAKRGRKRKPKTNWEKLFAGATAEIGRLNKQVQQLQGN